MTFIHQVMLYFCTAVCVLYLLSGGYSAVRYFRRRQADKSAAEKISASQSAGTRPEDPRIPEQPS
ncbi:DUF1378 family protein [Escherichia coli O4]|nr:DUF1378 family protein [Escherichia coli]EKK2312487.1 DUF1378 family protein [Escherichia coli O4]EKH4130977.1 DUF1378 family protein [Escherichia coli]EKK3473072.1 DUF1378 family protein [Escherichia coli O4]EKL8940852.1 DUF1378 family protein [Escherichia coli]